MKTVEKSVKLAKQEVGPAQVSVYETQEDLEALSLEKLLDLVNRQTCTDTCNAVRAQNRESTPGKGKRYNTAFNVLPGVVFADGATGLDKLTECATLDDEDSRKKAMDDLLMSPEVQKAVDAKLAG